MPNKKTPENNPGVKRGLTLTQTKQDNTSSSKKKKSLLKCALAYARAGFKVFPCRSGRKDPDGFLVEHGHNDGSLEAKQIIAWWTKHPNANIGLVPPKGYAIIDIDPRDGGLETAKRFKLPTTLVARSGGKDHGFHYFYKDAPHLPGKLGPGIQLKANGTGYVIAPPSIHPSGGQYCWDTEFDPEMIASWPKEVMPSAGNSVSKYDPAGDASAENTLLTPSQLRQILEQIDADDYDDWIATGQALKRDYPDIGFDLWVQYSQRSKKFPGVSLLSKKWESFKRNDRGTGTLVFMAGGRIPKAAPEEEFEKIEKSGLQVIKLSEITPQKIDWLVPGYFAKGMVHCVAGHGGAGKSLVITSLISALSQGVDWLTGEITSPIDVLMITEEQLQISVAPRMLLAGADMSRVNIIVGTTKKKVEKGKEIIVPWNLDDHFGDTEKWFREHPEIKLLVIDPIGSFMEGDKREIDTWKDSNVRKVLDKWVKLAEALNIAIIYLAHFNKSKGTRAADKITGSSAFTTVTRMTYIVGQINAEWLETQGYPGNGDDRIMVGVKCNIGRKPPVLVIGVEPGQPDPQIPRIFMKGCLAEGCQGEAEQLLMDGYVPEVKQGTNFDKTLKIIEAKPGITRRGIAQELEIGEANVTQYIDRLVAQGLVTKIRNGNETWNYAKGSKELELLE